VEDGAFVVGVDGFVVAGGAVYVACGINRISEALACE
jgi:hypothetical protein